VSEDRDDEDVVYESEFIIVSLKKSNLRTREFLLKDVGNDKRILLYQTSQTLDYEGESQNKLLLFTVIVDLFVLLGVGFGLIVANNDSLHECVHELVDPLALTWRKLKYLGASDRVFVQFFEF